MSKTNKLPGSLHSKVRIIFDELSNFDVAELADLETIAEWPQSVRQLLLTSVILLVVTTGYVSFLSAVRIELESGQVREAQLRAEFSLKAMEASQLGAMQAQTEALGLAFKGLLRPSKAFFCLRNRSVAG